MAAASKYIEACKVPGALANLLDHFGFARTPEIAYILECSLVNLDSHNILYGDPNFAARLSNSSFQLKEDLIEALVEDILNYL